MKRVVIGLSGGVDSSVAAYLLKQQGYDVVGFFMINWLDPTGTLEGDCPWKDDLIFAGLVAKKLDIPLHTFDFSEQYKERVVDYMFREYAHGRTPNPDVLCNREVKFDVFLEAALKYKADYIATGHYCRLVTIQADDRDVHQLLAGADPDKDQSYFLCQLNQQQLERVIFPIGDMQKSEVRNIATELDLPTADRKDSQGICFVGKVDLPTFLQQQLQPKKGDIIEIPKDAAIFKPDNFNYNEDFSETDLKEYSEEIRYRPDDGDKTGEHNGAHFFTVGQRKGLNVGGKKEPLFVLQNDTKNNVLYVGQGHDHPGLNRHGLFIPHKDIHWIRPDLALNAGNSREMLVRIRYRQPLQSARLYMQKDGLYIIFREKQRGITPGQFAAWYDKEELIGSGVIQ